MADTADEDPVAEAREEVVEAMARSAEVYGVSRSYGRLYGELFFAEDALSLDELVEQSGYAKSTVSTAMKGLERLHLVTRRSKPGEGKKAFYEAERDFWYVFQQFLREQVTREIQLMGRALDDAAETLEGLDDERADRDLERIRELQRVYDRSERLVDLLTSQSLERLSGVVERLRS